MKVLILYGSIEGQTAKIARVVADEVTAAGHEAMLVDADAPEALQLDGVDAAILAASVHQRRHPRQFEALLAGYASQLKDIKTLMLSVSLSAAFPEGQEEANDYLTEMKMRTNFEPDDELLVAGAVKTSSYDYFAMQVVRHVVLRDRNDVDPSQGEHEFTDWDVLGAKVYDFLG